MKAPSQHPPPNGTSESNAYWRGWNGQSVEDYSSSGQAAYDRGQRDGHAVDNFIAAIWRDTPKSEW